MTAIEKISEAWDSDRDERLFRITACPGSVTTVLSRFDCRLKGWMMV